MARSGRVRGRASCYSEHRHAGLDSEAAALELHPFLHRVPEIETPTSIVFDLDPGTGLELAV